MAFIPPSPLRCFVMDMPQLLSPHSENKGGCGVRLMGTIVSIHNVPAQFDSTQCHDYRGAFIRPHEEFLLLQLDDGTGTIFCVTPLTERTLHVGQLLDCVGQPFLRDTTGDNNKHQTQLGLLVDTLLEVNDKPTVAEKLRWREIMTMQRGTKTLSSRASKVMDWCGYPCPEITKEDIFQVIESTESVTASELATVMDIEITHVQALIEDLQVDGLIYQNEKGSYVPL